jgi:hypothetical protein
LTLLIRLQEKALRSFRCCTCICVFYPCLISLVKTIDGEVPDPMPDFTAKKSDVQPATGYTWCFYSYMFVSLAARCAMSAFSLMMIVQRFCIFLLTACIFHMYIIILSYNVHDSWICPICFFSICIICFSICIICSGCFSSFWCFQLVYSPRVPPVSHGFPRSPPPPSAVDRSSSVLWQVETGERYRKNGNPDPNQSRLSWFLVGGFICFHNIWENPSHWLIFFKDV